MTIKCFDKYRNQHLIIEIMDDQLWELDSFSSNYCTGKVGLSFTIDKEYYKKHPDESGEDPHPERWSDLTALELIQ
jgi:hypothetical protein